jgi:uncharacterized protein YecT (DUF1311 family)
MIFMLRALSASIFVLLVFAAPAAARADALYDSCMKTAMSNVDFGTCGAAAIKRADAALNRTWQQVYGATTGLIKTDLLAEQRAWNGYKALSCKLYANGDQGREGAVIGFPACRAKVIEERTKDLQDIGKSLQRP